MRGTGYGSAGGELGDVSAPNETGCADRAVSRRAGGRSRGLPLLAWLVVAALALAACASDDTAEDAADEPEVEIDDDPVADPIDPEDVVLVVATHDDALEAMADSLAAGSWRWSGRIDVTLTDEDLERIASEPQTPSVREMQDEMDDYGAFSAHGAKGEDGSWQTTVVHRSREVVDVRSSGGELLDGSTLTPEVTLLVRVDWLYLLTEFWDPVDFPGGTSPEEELAEARRQTEAELAGSPFLDVVLALLDGRWAGLSGVVDLTSFGVTEEDLQEAAEGFREELIGLADRDTMLELVDRSVTLRDFTPVGTDGGSVAVLDVHPHDAAAAVYEVFEDAAGLATAHDDELPETLEGVATVTFDANGMMTEVSTDVMAIMLQVAEHGLEQGSSSGFGATEEDVELLRGLDGSMAVVVGFSDHGQVPTVLDVADAVTAEWNDLAELVADLFTVEWDEDWDDEWMTDDWEEDWEDWPDGEPGGAEDQKDPGANTRPGAAPDDEWLEEYWACVAEVPDGAWDELEGCDELLP